MQLPPKNGANHHVTRPRDQPQKGSIHLHVCVRRMKPTAATTTMWLGAREIGQGISGTTPGGEIPSPSAGRRPGGAGSKRTRAGRYRKPYPSLRLGSTCMPFFGQFRGSAVPFRDFGDGEFVDSAWLTIRALLFSWGRDIFGRAVQWLTNGFSRVVAHSRSFP